MTHFKTNARRILTLVATLAMTSAHAADTIRGFDDAARLAVERQPTGIVHKIERERHLMRDVYEVELKLPDGCEVELVLLATDGSVVREKHDCD